MINSVVIQVISINILNLFMLALLNIFYFLKPRINRIEHVIFGRMILCSFFGSMIGLFFGILTSIYPIVNFITVFLEKTYNILVIDWILLLSLYTFVISTSKNYENGFFNRILNNILVGSLILYLVPVNIEVVENKILVTGILLDLTYIISAVVMVFNMIMIFKNIKHIREKKYVPIYSMIILSILFIGVQAANPDFNYLNSLLGMIIGYLMYFTIENPDVKMIEELVKVQKLSEKTNNDKSNFVYTVSEDIQNRLNNAEIVYNNVMSLKPNDDIVREMKELKEVIVGARNMLNSAIGISDNDSKHLGLTNNKYNISLLLDSIYASKKNEVNSNTEFRLNITDDLPKELYGDSIKIKQILNTIIDNSIKYTEKGFIEFRVNSIIKNNICRLIMTVEDSGKGIDIFKQNEIMSNSNDLTKDDIESLNDKNLNLKVVRKMISIIGGTFIIDNNKYGGTTVNISLDQKIVEDKKTKEEKQIAKYSEELKNQKTCAIISMNKEYIKVIKGVSKKAGFKVFDFNVCKEALDNIRNSIKYDVIFIDEYMEKIDARSFINKVKEVENFNGKVIVISKFKDIKNKKELLGLGFSNILYIPIDKKDVLSKLENLK